MDEVWNRDVRFSGRVIEPFAGGITDVTYHIQEESALGAVTMTFNLEEFLDGAFVFNLPLARNFGLGPPELFV